MSAADLVTSLEVELRSPMSVLAELEAQFDQLLERDDVEPLLPLLVRLEERLPRSPTVHQLYARLHTHRGQREHAATAAAEASRLLDELRTSTRLSVDDAVDIARLLLALGRVTDADELLAPSIESGDENVALLMLWARLKHRQGQLTEAIKAIDKLRLITRSGHGPIHRLELIQRIAQARAEEVSQGTTSRRERAERDLERVFMLAAQSQFRAAIEACAALAEQHQAREHDIYELAMFQQALLQEHIGAFDAALDVLAQLERELPTERRADSRVDRLRTTARLHERRGNPADLRVAGATYRQLAASSGSSMYLSRASQVARVATTTDEAERLAAEQLRAFREEQHQPSAAQAVRAAAKYYVSITDLRALKLPRDELEASRARLIRELAQVDARLAATPGPAAPSELEARAELLRQVALTLALLEQISPSRDIWRGLIVDDAARAEDLKYLADVRQELGDHDGARALRLSALSEEPLIDASTLRLLVATGDAEATRVARAVFKNPDKRETALRELRRRARIHSSSPAAWRDLALFERLVGLEAEANRHTAKAEALASAHEHPSVRVGRVRVIGVYESRGEKQGIIHEIWAGRYRVGEGLPGGLSVAVTDEGGQLGKGSIFGNLTPEMMRDIRSVFLAVSALARSAFPHLVEDLSQHRYILKFSKDDAPSGGSSAGAGVALAFLSVFLQRPLPDDFAISGELVTDSTSSLRLRDIGDVEEKVLATLEVGLRRLILPAGNRDDLVRSDRVPRAVWEPMCSFVADFRQVLSSVFGEEVWDW